jgi:multicomponent Na+:H+ antiporter subunit D
VTAGAVLRAAVRIFLGWGRPPEPATGETTGENEEPETEQAEQRTSVPMVTAVAVLLGLGLAVGIVPPLLRAVSRGAELFTDPAGYRSQALLLAAGPTPEASPAVAWTTTGVVLGLVSTVIAVVIAGLGLRGARLSGVAPLMTGLRRAHSGHIGDYVAWLFAGVAALAVLVGLPLL